MTRLKPLKITRHHISNTLFALVCLFLLVYIISGLTDTGLRFFILRSGSMAPVISAGDIAVVLRTPDPSRIQPGDVIAYHHPQDLDQVIVHRVISVTPEGFITQGDANPAPDAAPVAAAQVVGVFRFNIPLLGYFFEGIKQALIWLLARLPGGVGAAFLVPQLFQTEAW